MKISIENGATVGQKRIVSVDSRESVLVGLHPLSEDYREDYAAQRTSNGPVVSFVRDCP